MRAFSYRYSYLRSRKKDGGHLGEILLHYSAPLCCYRRRVRLLHGNGINIHCADADLSWHACIRCACTCSGPFSVLWPWPWSA